MTDVEHPPESTAAAPYREDRAGAATQAVDEAAAPPAVTPVAAARARWAVTGVFFVNGLLLATYLSRIPSIKVGHGYGAAEFGAVLSLVGIAALVTMQFVGGLVGRFGSARVLRGALLLMPLALVGVGFAGGTAELVVALILLGAVHGTIDVSMNAHAVVVERAAGHPIMNGCHGAWSVSAVTASLIGAGATRAHVTPAAHFLWVAAAMLIVCLPLTRYLLPASIDRNAPGRERERGARSDWRTGWTRRVLMYGAMGAAFMVCESAVISWSGVFLHEIRGATLAAAALGYGAYTGFQTVVRLVGDRLTTRLGGATLFRISGMVAIAGLLIVVLVRSEAFAIAGFAVIGAGSAAMLPLIFSAVGHAGGEGSGAATFVSRVTTFAYGGILLGPALIGWFAALFSLTWTYAALIPLMGGLVLGGRLMSAAGSPSHATSD